MDKNEILEKRKLLEFFKMNGMHESYRNLEAELAEIEEINVDSVSYNSVNPISEYQSLSKRMQQKIKEIIDSLDEEKKKEIEKTLESSDRDEKDTLDEKDGKEELDSDKKEKVEDEERKRIKEDGTEETGREDDDKEQDEKDKGKDEVDESNVKKEETTKKDEYLAKLQKLHKMRIVDYKEQLREDEAKYDRYFVTMVYLQRELTRTRDAFVKAYGDEELTYLENQYLREELQYQKTLDINLEKDLSKLRFLDEKLESILDRIQTLQQGLENESLSLEEYNREIDSLENDKLDTLWQINRLNPALLEQKQDIIMQREGFEKEKIPMNAQKQKSVNPEIKEKQKSLDYMEKKQEGVAEKAHKNIENELQIDIDKKEKRLAELRKELENTDIQSPKGKERALQILGEMQMLESEKAAQEIQTKNMEKNMDSNVQSYGDLKNPERDRAEDTKEFQNNISKLDGEDVSTELLAQLKKDVKEVPSTPEQAQELVDDMNKIAEDAKKEAEGREEPEEDKEKTLFRKYGFNNNNRKDT